MALTNTGKLKKGERLKIGPQHLEAPELRTWIWGAGIDYLKKIISIYNNFKLRKTS